MTNELGMTLQDLEDKAERKAMALACLGAINQSAMHGLEKRAHESLLECFNFVRQYIEQS